MTPDARRGHTAAVVTGAAGGIGAAVTARLVRAGVSVVAVDIEATGLHLLAERFPSGAVVPVTADVSAEEGVQTYIAAALDAFGRIDLFHNNAGTEGRVAPLHESDVRDFDRVMCVNVRGVYLGLRAVLREMRSTGGGAIVNTASVAGLRARAGLGPYVASKHAVIGLTKNAAIESADHGVRVNAVCPGPVSTPMIDRIERGSDGEPSRSRRADAGADAAMHRYATPDEVASLVCWLLGDDAGFVNGAAYTVDGGRTAW